MSIGPPASENRKSKVFYRADFLFWHFLFPVWSQKKKYWNAMAYSYLTSMVRDCKRLNSQVRRALREKGRVLELRVTVEVNLHRDVSE